MSPSRTLRILLFVGNLMGRVYTWVYIMRCSFSTVLNSIPYLKWHHSSNREDIRSPAAYSNSPKLTRSTAVSSKLHVYKYTESKTLSSFQHRGAHLAITSTKGSMYYDSLVIRMHSQLELQCIGAPYPASLPANNSRRRASEPNPHGMTVRYK